MLRDHAADEGIKPIPIFGNGDAYDYRTYYENMESSGVDGIMIARGALIKVSQLTLASVEKCTKVWVCLTALDLLRDQGEKGL